MSDLSHVVNHALSNVTPYRFLTGAGIGFSTLFFFANVGANNFGLVPIISNPALRNEFGIPIESAVRQWNWFFAKAMVSKDAPQKYNDARKAYFIFTIFDLTALVCS